MPKKKVKLQQTQLRRSARLNKMEDEKVPDELHQQIRDMDMSMEEFNEAAKKTGIAEVSKSLGATDADETNIVDPENSDGEEGDLWLAATQSAKEAASGKEKMDATDAPSLDLQMTNKIMAKSVEGMSKTLGLLDPAPRKPKTSQDRIMEWEKRTNHRLSGPAFGMLTKMVEQYPTCDDQNMEWALYGWEARGDNNIVEVKNVHQSMQDMIHNNLTTMNEFKRDTAALTAGLRECYKELQAMTHAAKEFAAPTKYRAVSVPAKPSSSRTTQMTINEPTPVKVVPAKDLQGNMKLILKLIGKKLEDYTRFCTPDVIGGILGDLVGNMNQTDWDFLGTSDGKAAMNQLIADAIEKHQSN
uniref:Protein 2 n=1 Tax=Vincetoxicum virus 1 TaxID=2977998 RepID=A0A9N6YIZ0_9RHAB|nr:TPA_asm: protein 2 [Vincetoxicum virus 1]